MTHLGDNEPRQGGLLPAWLTVLITLVLTVLFAFNVAADVTVKGYSGYPTTALIGALIGSILGIDRYLRRGGPQ